MGKNPLDEATRSMRRSELDALREVFPEGEPEAIQVRLERGTHRGAAPTEEPHVALEIHTKNRTYAVGPDLTCIRVVDRQTREARTDHPAVGARLTGGQRRYGKTVHFARPFPVPGTEAVFLSPDDPRSPAAITSKVESVVLRIRIDTMVLQEEGAADEITSALLRSSLVGDEP